MVGWVAVWQAAKKGLSHSPYVTCFPSVSAVRICYQPAPADGLSVLNCSHLTMSPFLFCLPVTLPPVPCALLVSRVTWMWSLTRESWCMLKAWRLQHKRAHKQSSHLLVCQQHGYALTQSWFRVRLLFTGEGISGEYCFRAWDRPWQWCMELHILSFSLINMQLPGGEQMAEPSSPPAGCCRHATGISVGTTAGPGSPLGPGFYPTLTEPACPAQTIADRTGPLTIRHCPGTITNAINKVKNVPCHQLIPTRYAFRECAKSSHDDTF